MVKELEEALDALYDIEGVEACILYRIDGVPVILRAREYREQLLETMFWLEKQIRHVLGEMNKEGLEETFFLFQEAQDYDSTFLEIYCTGDGHRGRGESTAHLTGDAAHKQDY